MNTIILARNGVGCLGTVEGRHLATVVSKAAINDGDCRLPLEVERWCCEVDGLHIGQQPHDAARGGSAGTSGGRAGTSGGSGNSGDAGGGSGGIVEQSGKARVRARNGSGAPATATAVTPGSLVPAMPAPMRVPLRDGSTGGLQAQLQRAPYNSAPQGQADEQTAAADVCTDPGAAPDGWSGAKCMRTPVQHHFMNRAPNTWSRTAASNPWGRVRDRTQPTPFSRQSMVGCTALTPLATPWVSLSPAVPLVRSAHLRLLLCPSSAAAQGMGYRATAAADAGVCVPWRRPAGHRCPPRQHGLAQVRRPGRHRRLKGRELWAGGPARSCHAAAAQASAPAPPLAGRSRHQSQWW